MIINGLTENYECYLVDNGTIDTVISVNGHEIVFSHEFACDFRTLDGDFTDNSFRELCEIAIDEYQYDCFE